MLNKSWRRGDSSEENGMFKGAEPSSQSAMQVANGSKRPEGIETTTLSAVEVNTSMTVSIQ